MTKRNQTDEAGPEQGVVALGKLGSHATALGQLDTYYDAGRFTEILKPSMPELESLAAMSRSITELTFNTEMFNVIAKMADQFRPVWEQITEMMEQFRPVWEQITEMTDLSKLVADQIITSHIPNYRSWQRAWIGSTDIGLLTEWQQRWIDSCVSGDASAWNDWSSKLTVDFLARGTMGFSGKLFDLDTATKILSAVTEEDDLPYIGALYMGGSDTAIETPGQIWSPRENIWVKLPSQKREDKDRKKQQ